MTRQLVIGIVALARSQTGKAVFLLLTVDQSANGIVGVQVGGDAAAIGLRQAVYPAFAVVHIAKNLAVRIGRSFFLPRVS